MALRIGLLACVAWLSAAAAAQASNIVFVCGKDLCSAPDDGSERVRLTRDGAAAGAYTSPSVSRSGKRIAYTRGERGRVFTARLVRRRGRIRALRDSRRIPPFGDGAPDSTQFDAIVLFDTRTARPVRDLTSGGGDSSPVLSPDGRRVAFERSGSTFSVRVAGGAARRLLRGAREPSWSR